MMLVKQFGVLVNIFNCRLKKYLASVFKSEGSTSLRNSFL